MSTEITTETVTTPTAPVVAATETTPPTIESLQAIIDSQNAEVEKWKGLSRKNEGRATSNADAAKKAEKLDEVLATLAKLGGAEPDANSQPDALALIAELNKKITDGELRATRAEVIAEKKIPAAALPLITGTNREEIEASCDAVLALLGTAAAPASNSADANGAVGTHVTDGVAQVTHDEFKKMSSAEKLKAQADGRLVALLSSN